MPLKTRLLTIGTTPVVLASSTVAATSTAAMSLAGAFGTDTVPIVIHSATTGLILLGDVSMTTVSTARGLPFNGPGYFTYNLLPSDSLWALTTGANVDITIQAGRQTI